VSAWVRRPLLMLALPLALARVRVREQLSAPQESVPGPASPPPPPQRCTAHRPAAAGRAGAGQRGAPAPEWSPPTCWSPCGTARWPRRTQRGRAGPSPAGTSPGSPGTGTCPSRPGSPSWRTSGQGEGGGRARGCSGRRVRGRGGVEGAGAEGAGRSTCVRCARPIEGAGCTARRGCATAGGAHDSKGIGLREAAAVGGCWGAAQAAHGVWVRRGAVRCKAARSGEGRRGNKDKGCTSPAWAARCGQQ
jgi:hypothetical protein